MNEDDLIFLLGQCRSRNEKQDVTGMLLYVDGNYIQALEGDEKDVDEIYSDIVKDYRNTGNILMIKSEISERAFSGWSMGFKHLSDTNKGKIEGYTDFLNKKMTPGEIANSSSLAVKLLYSFKTTNPS